MAWVVVLDGSLPDQKLLLPPPAAADLPTC
jgi:hypothetical protein